MIKSDFDVFCVGILIAAIISIPILFSVKSITNEVRNSDNYIEFKRGENDYKNEKL
jgi:hypothetical protein